MKKLLTLLISLILVSCVSDSNSDEFIAKAEGRYLYNSDETVSVYFQEKELYLNWRGATKIKPMPTGNEEFYVKEMNEKILFKTNPIDNEVYMCLIPKEDAEITYNFKKLGDEEQVPSFYIKEKNFNKAKEGYLAIQAKDSIDPNINEDKFNRMGYDFLREEEFDNAIGIFDINIALFPRSSNVYDSMGDALLRKGDTISGVEFYRKAYNLNSDNDRAKRIIENFDKNNKKNGSE